MALYKTVSSLVLRGWHMRDNYILLESKFFLQKASQNCFDFPAPVTTRHSSRNSFTLDCCEAKDPRVSTKDRQVPLDLYLMLWRSKLCRISRGRGGFTVIRRLRVSVGPVVKDQVNQRASLLTLNDPSLIESATRSKYRSKGSKVHCKGPK